MVANFLLPVGIGRRRRRGVSIGVPPTPSAG
jgi:hypothetical protein